MFDFNELEIIKKSVEMVTIKGADSHVISALLIKIDQQIKNIPESQKK